MSKQIYLVLADGTIYAGKSFGAAGTALGEVVFATGVTGYLETLTDPSYYGQLVVQTFPLIGNYGVIPGDFESKSPHVQGYIVREWCDLPSNFRSEGDIDAYLKKNNIIGLYGIDTRSLTRRLRTVGVMNGMITDNVENIAEILEKIKGYAITQAVPAVTRQENEEIKAAKPRYKIALWDFGVKGSIGEKLAKRGCDVVIVPAGATADEIEALDVDGILLSNGPGDPAENTAVIAEIRRWMEKKIPTFGICLGHQLLALSQGAKTAKLKYGHRGGNQPVRELTTGSVYITSQNHGYAVDRDSLPPHAQLLYENVSDLTCEGILYKDLPAFSVQFHPEAASGPLDTGFLFDRFLKLIDDTKGGKDNAAK